MHRNSKYFQLLADNRGKGAGIRASADGSTLYLYDAIVDSPAEAEWFGGVDPQTFIAALSGIDSDVVHLRINSPGGSVFAARAMEAAINEHSARFVIHVDGLAASAASFLAMAGDEIVMSDGAMMMIHKAWTLAYGNADDLLATAALLEKIDATLVQTYAARTGQAAEDIAQMMSDETWFTAEEAVAAGFSDSIAPKKEKAKASAWNLSAYGKAPKADEKESCGIDAAAYLRRLSAALV